MTGPLEHAKGEAWPSADQLDWRRYMAPPWHAIAHGLPKSPTAEDVPDILRAILTVLLMQGPSQSGPSAAEIGRAVRGSSY
jgi:hypothetical protein